MKDLQINHRPREQTQIKKFISNLKQRYPATQTASYFNDRKKPKTLNEHERQVYDISWNDSVSNENYVDPCFMRQIREEGYISPTKPKKKIIKSYLTKKHFRRRRVMTYDLTDDFNYPIEEIEDDDNSEDECQVIGRKGATNKASTPRKRKSNDSDDDCNSIHDSLKPIHSQRSHISMAKQEPKYRQRDYSLISESEDDQKALKSKSKQRMSPGQINNERVQSKKHSYKSPGPRSPALGSTPQKRIMVIKSAAPNYSPFSSDSKQNIKPSNSNKKSHYSKREHDHSIKKSKRVATATSIHATPLSIKQSTSPALEGKSAHHNNISPLKKRADQKDEHSKNKSDEIKEIMEQANAFSLVFGVGVSEVLKLFKELDCDFEKVKLCLMQK